MVGARLRNDDSDRDQREPERDSQEEKSNMKNRLKHYVVSLCLGLLGVSAAHADYQGPTDNITKVANAVQIRSKSLTTVVEINRGLAVTQPVELSIGYYSPAGSYRVSQTYSPSSGNRIVYNDREGDGQARQMRIDISFAEKKTVGRPYLFSIAKTVELNPVYSVAFGPLSFSLLNACDSVGKNEIRFMWRRPPDRRDYEMRFSLPSGKTQVIKEFAWSATEISASKKIQLPVFYFEESDPGPFEGLALYSQGNGAVVLGKTRTVRSTVSEATKQCTGLYQYTVQSRLLVYSNL